MRDSKELKRLPLKRRSNNWYHGNISREETEKLLKGLPSGAYLIRYSNSTHKYILSLTNSRQFYHYPIEELSDGFYQVNGTTAKYLGIDLLISDFKRNNNCIVCPLLMPINGQKPPAHISVYGITTELHGAVRKGNFKQVKDLIFKLKNLPNCNLKEYINEKSADSGASSLIDAAKIGSNDIVKFLLENGALANLRDCGGFTALHRACQKSFAHVAETLLKGSSVTSSRSNPQIKCPFTGNTALHEAAQLGHFDCINTLLKYRAAPWSRNFDDEMPFELAGRFGFEDLSCALASFKMPSSVTNKNDWYHPNLSRVESETIFAKKAVQKDGTFLIRNSSQADRKYVLVLWCSEQLLKYQINVIDFPLQSETSEAFFIDKGPFHTSLESLVEHYSCFPDGIPTRLRYAVSVKGHLINLDQMLQINSKNSFQKNGEIFQILNNMESQIITNQNNNIIGTSALRGPKKNLNTTTTISSSSGVSMTTASSSQSAFSPNITNSTGNDSVLDPLNLNSPEIRMIPSNDVTLFFRLGEGEFGEVYHGKLKSYEGNAMNIQDVAVKVLVQPSQRMDFLKEATIMMKLQHPHIITIFGVCENKRLMMVLELAETGSLLDYLLDNPDKCQLLDLYNWAMQIASGMSYLESCGFVHRDLACRNVLLSTPTCAKISDFGLSRAVLIESDYYKATQRGKWPVKWYAPESIYYKTFSHASDVWSFGVCLWEMFTLGEHPYSDMDSIEVLRQIEEGSRLPRPELAPDDVFAIMHDCWAYNPEARPTFGQLLGMFQHLANNVYENVDMNYSANVEFPLVDFMSDQGNNTANSKSLPRSTSSTDNSSKATPVN